MFCYWKDEFGMHMGCLVNIVAEQTFFTLFGHPLSGHYHCVEEGAEASREQHKMIDWKNSNHLSFTTTL